VSTWENVYAVVHFLLAFLAFEELNAFNVVSITVTLIHVISIAMLAFKTVSCITSKGKIYTEDLFKLIIISEFNLFKVVE
jgi:hypothetical protein